jgi:pycsar effector protein
MRRHPIQNDRDAASPAQGAPLLPGERPYFDEERLQRTLDRMLQWITAADGKVEPILTIDTVMLGVLSALAADRKDPASLAFVAAGLAVLALLASLGMMAAAAFPRMRGPSRSLGYFGGITARTEAEYVDEMERAAEPEYRRDLMVQIYRNAQIASTKYRCVQLSMAFLFIAVIPWICAVYLFFAGPGS